MSALKLVGVLFETFPAPAVDSMLRPYLELIWRRQQSGVAGSELTLWSFHVIATMIHYNCEEVLQIMEAAQITQAVFTIWFSKLGLVKRFENRKVALLAFTQLLRVAPAVPIPVLHAGLPQIIAQACLQAVDCWRLRREKAEHDAQSDSSSEDSDESDDLQDLDDEQDAYHSKYMKKYEKLNRELEGEDDDDSDESDDDEQEAGWRETRWTLSTSACSSARRCRSCRRSSSSRWRRRSVRTCSASSARWKRWPRTRRA